MELFARRAVPAEATFNWFGDLRTHSDVTVTTSSALTDDAVLACVSLIAGDIASLPLRAFATTPSGLTEPLRRQPAWLEVPDPFDLAVTSVGHRSQVALSILLAGNAYVLCEPSVLDVERLAVIDPTAVTVRKPGRERLFDVRRQALGDPGASPSDVETLTSAQVLHIPYMPLPGRLTGLSIVSAQAGNIGIGIAMRRWLETFFGKGAQAAGFVSVPTGASQQQVDDTAARIERRWGGWRKAGVIGVLAGGATWVRTGLSTQDANLDALWRRQLEAVARVYGIPPFMVGSQEPAGVAYASAVERAQGYIDHCLTRYTRPIEMAYSRLVPGDGRLSSPGSDTEARFVFDALLRGDPKARWDTYLSALQAKARPIGEVRALENLPPMSDYSEEYLAGPDGLLQTPNNNGARSAPEPDGGEP